MPIAGLCPVPCFALVRGCFFIVNQASPVGFALWGHGRGRLFVYTAVILGEPRCLVGVRRSDRIKIECQKLKIKNTGRDI